MIRRIWIKPTMTLILLLTLNLFNISYANTSSYYTDGFVFPVIKKEPVNPDQFVLNEIDPLADGWLGNGLSEAYDPTIGGHLAQDYFLPTGTTAGKKVYAVANGVVVEVMNYNTQYGWCDEEHHGWGRVIIIKHEAPPGTVFNTVNSIISEDYNFLDDRYPGSTEKNPSIVYTLYGHLSKTDLKVKKGDFIKKGQSIAVIGNYPEDQPWTTPHLHFEIKSQKGFEEGVWDKSNPGKHLKPQSCNAQGVGSGYSYIDNYAPDRYNPSIFIKTAQTSQQSPIPNIKANNSDSSVIIQSTDKLSLTVELDTGNYTGTNADWWLAANTPLDWYYYFCDKDGCSWKPGASTTYKGPLYNLPQTEVLNTLGLPQGDYTFYFGIEVDTGNTNDKQLVYDEIKIIALPTEYSISGAVTLKNGTGLSGITMALTGPTSKSTTTDINGNYNFAGLNNGSYTLTPSKSGYTFNPTNLIFTINNNDKKQNFTTNTIIKTSILTINKSGNGYGTVNSSPAGISCGNTCSASFNQGTQISLKAIPSQSSIFTGWSGACSGTGTCSVTMDADKTATATFQTNNPPTATITNPLNGDTYTQFQSITFNGSGYDLKDGTLNAGSLVWTSNIDGQIGTGTSFTKNDLSIGTHTITLVATDSYGATGNNNVSILISSPTTDQITLGSTSIDFGNTQVGSCETSVFAIQYVSGTGSTTSTFSMNLNPPFSILSGSISVSNGSTTNIPVQFCPTSSGTFSGTVTVSSSATFTGPNTVTLTGTGSSPTNSPTATTGTYQIISSTSAQLFGTVNPNGLSTTGWFQYGTSTSYGSTTNSESIGSGNSSVQILHSISNLAPSTTYLFRAVGKNSAGTNYGNDMTFTTPAPSIVKPTVTTTSATSITTSGATLNGSVNPNGSACTSWFQYGTSTSYGSTTQTMPYNGSSTSPITMNWSIGSLSPGTTYHFRAVSQNSVGTNYGNDMSFTISASLVTKPSSPNLNSPGTSSSPGPVISDLTPTLNWQSVSGATFYNFGLRDLDTYSLVVDKDNYTSTSYTTPNLTAGHQYRWNVQACNSSGCSGYSSLYYFQAKSLSVPAPYISSINPNPVIGSTSQQTITLYGTGFKSGLSVYVTWTGDAKTLGSSQVSVDSSNQVRIFINTWTDPDTWTVRITNSDGKVSNTKSFIVI
jgi:murein DD-endopeptidase MepM/ murein hydrolase activator NlpD